MNDRHQFLRRLSLDPKYQKYVVGPLESMRKEFEDTLKNVESTEGQVRYAQGALKVIDQHRHLFDRNDALINANERQKEERRNARTRTANYTSGRYCT